MNCRPIHIVGILAIWLLAAGTVPAQNIDPNNKFAYGENVGWVNFDPNHGPGVTVTDDKLTGFVWAENIGWIKLDPNDSDPDTGVTNDGTGLLAGYAWAENAGWVNFRPTQGPGVTIDSSGNFDGWAWGENIGWIHFRSASPVHYKVRTSWTTSCVVDIYDLAKFCRQWLFQPDLAKVGHWPLDEIPAGIAADIGSGGNNANLVGDTGWVNDASRSICLDFDGSGDYIKTADLTNQLNFAPGSFSASVWIKPRQVAGAGWIAILEYDRGGTNWFGLWLNNTGNFHFRVGSDTKTSTQTLSPDRWYLVTGTYDSATNLMSLYIDGQFDSSHTHSTGFAAPIAAKLTIGVRGYEDAEYFDGRIDDLRVYDLLLTSDQIRSLFDGLAADFDSSGNVDFADYSSFAELWLEPCPPGWPLKD